MRIRAGIVLAAVVASASSVSVGAQEAGQVVDAVLGAYGGVQRLRAIAGYRYDATMRTSRGEDATVVRVSSGADTLEVRISYPDRAEIRRLVAGEGWRGSSEEDLRAAEGPMLTSMIGQAMRANLPWLLAGARDSVEVLSREPERIVVGLVSPAGVSLRISIEPETHRIVRTESLVSAGEMQLQFATDYSDFRDVSGVLFPFHEESWAQGTHTASLDVQSIELESSSER